MDRFKGMIWGAVIGDTLGTYYKGNKQTDNKYNIDWQDVDFKEKTGNEWSSITDQVIILMASLLKAKKLNSPIVNCFVFAKGLKDWQDNGIIEIPPKEKYLGMRFNFTLKQEGYLQNPIKSCKKSYKLMGGDYAENEALSRNAICGATRQWYKNTILQTIITNYDSRCLSASLVNSYIIHCLYDKVPIQWNYINPICQKIIIDHKIKKTANLTEFNNNWHIALNYSNLVKKEEHDDSNFLSFLKKLNIGNYNYIENQSYVFLGMILSIITVIDIQHKIKNKEVIDTEYYCRRIKEVVSLGGDATSNAAIVGSIIGLFIGYENLPNDWIKGISCADWLELQIDNFITGK